MSVFRALHTPVTSAPRAAAIWTANVPTPPAAPFTRTRWPGLNVTAVADRVQGGHGRHRYRRRLFERQAGRFRDHEGGVGDGVFGEGAPGEAKDLITHPQAVDVGADVLDSTGDVDSGDSGLRFGQADAAHQAGDARITADHVPVVGVDSGGMHFQTHFTGTDLGSAGIHQLEGVGRAETVLHDRRHQVSAGAVRFVGATAFPLATLISTPSLQMWVGGARHIPLVE